MAAVPLARAIAAEALGSAALACVVVGSGIMAERLAGGNAALALLANTLATSAALYVLIVALAPISGAHFNPLVSLLEAIAHRISYSRAMAFVAVQVIAMVGGVLAAHAMFELPLVQLSTRARDGVGQWLAESVAAFGLIATLVLVSRARASAVPAAVACWIGAAYWFTASTSFANPAITVARALTDTFAGIRPLDTPGFIVAQCVGALLAWHLMHWLAGTESVARGN